MRHFLLTYELGEGYAARRGAHRKRHLALAWAACERGELLQGGAVGDPPEQALLLFRAEGPGAAERFAAADPYVTGGLVAAWRVSEWMTVVGAEAARPVRPEDLE